MIVRFIKTHSIGIPKGTIKNIDNKLAERFISTGYCEEVTEKEYKAYLKKLSDDKIKALNALNKKDCNCDEKPKRGKKTTVCKECEEKRLNKK